MIRPLLAAAALAAAALAPVPGSANHDGPPPATPFLELNPPLPTESGKLEVVEFFWYECPHCYSLEPHIEAWLKKLPKDVEFRRVPAMFNQQWAISGRAFYTLEAMGELDRLHRPLFDAIHKGGLKVTNQRQLQDWLERQKVDVAKFNAASKSFAVESRLKRALELMQASKIDSVPVLIVNGRYLVTADTARGQERMLAVADSLIERTRKQPASKAPKK
jgi:thiol:disulfide interchange protein DsbA